MSVDVKGYEKYIVSHIEAVQQMGDYFGISPKQMQVHDLSKWSDAEFLPYANQFFGDESTKNQVEFDQAWLHHIHNNPHHWPYWILGERPLEMPEHFAMEMICDWIGMGNTRTGDMTDWLISSSGTILLHQETASFVEVTLRNKCNNWVNMDKFTGFKVK